MRWLLVLAVVVACSGPGPRDPWDLVGERLYLYPESIERYAPDDRGAYVVRPRAAGPEARAALIAALAPADPDDIVDDGVVARLSEAERARIAREADVAILQPAARRGPGARGRVDLFADADDAEQAAVAAWLEARGAVIVARGKASLRVEAPPELLRELLREAARLGPVRWVE